MVESNAVSNWWGIYGCIFFVDWWWVSCQRHLIRRMWWCITVTLNYGRTKRSNIDLCKLKYVYGFLSKTAVQFWSQACPTENRDLDARWLKPWDFVAVDDREGILRCVVAEDTMYAPLGTITRAAGWRGPSQDVHYDLIIWYVSKIVYLL